MLDIYFVKGYVFGRCISRTINLEVLKSEIENLKGLSC